MSPFWMMGNGFLGIHKDFFKRKVFFCKRLIAFSMAWGACACPTHDSWKYSMVCYITVGQKYRGKITFLSPHFAQLPKKAKSRVQYGFESICFSTDF